MTGETRTESGATVKSSYVYDKLGQLASFTKSDGYSESYAYDAAGNMLEKVKNNQKIAMTYDAANELKTMTGNGGKIDYSYDANGNLTQKTMANYTDTYAYNVKNQLTSYKGYDGYQQRYSYNAQGHMTKRESKGNASRQSLEALAAGEGEAAAASKDGGSDDDPDPYANASSSDSWSTTTYVYDITAPYYEVLTETTNGTTTAYDYGVERLSSYSGSSAWNTIKTQYVYDGRGSVAQELSNNNSWYTLGGALAKRTKTSYSYTPFGELLDSSTAKTTFFAYNGESYDSATGMVNLRARWYEPATMRFSQRDTWSGKLEMPTTENRYLYCMNDPIGYYDHGGDRADEGSGTPKKVTPSTSVKTATPFSEDTAQSLRQEQFAIRKINSANRQLDTALRNAGVDPNNSSKATQQVVAKARQEIAQKAANGTLTASERDKIVQAVCTNGNGGISSVEGFLILASGKLIVNLYETMTFGSGFIDGLKGYNQENFGDSKIYYEGKLTGDIVRLLGTIYVGATAIVEILFGGAATFGGGGLSLTGAGALIGAPAMAGGVALVAAGVATIGTTIAIGVDALADFKKDWDAYQDASEEPTKEPMGKNKGDAPRNNQSQNKQVRDIETQLGLSKEEVRILHDEISGQGLSYNEILDLAKSMFGK